MVEKIEFPKDELIDFKIDIPDISQIKSNFSDIIFDDNYTQMKYMRNSSVFNTQKSTLSLSSLNGEIKFISVDINSMAPYSTILSEKDFFKIVGVGKNGISKRSGNYQESLYGYYLEAKESGDLGYIADILSKAVVFRNNLNFVKKLQTNKRFMREWRKCFGKETPVSHFKNSGNLRVFNIINESLQ